MADRHRPEHNDCEGYIIQRIAINYQYISYLNSVKKKEYIKNMDITVLERIAQFLQENGLSLTDITLEELRDIEAEQRARDNGLHVLDGYLDSCSASLTEIKIRAGKL